MEKPYILAIDDNAIFLDEVTDMLTGFYRVTGVKNIVDAMNVIIKKKEPALFLLDIEMPELDGYEIAKWLRNDKRFVKTPIIFLTGYDDKESVKKAIKCARNHYDYIAKPPDKEVLLKKIRQFNIR